MSLNRRIKERLQRYQAYRVAREVKWALERALETPKPKPADVVTELRPGERSRGNVLFFHINDVFLLKPSEPIPYWHSNRWEIKQMVQTFLDLGYAVDVVHWENDRFVPQKEYQICVDVRRQLPRILHLLPKDCLNIFHIDVANTLFQNFAEMKRLIALQDRRGVTLRPRRYEIPNQTIECADAATMLGNEFTRATFAYANKPIYPIPVSAPILYPWPENKNFDACRKRFLWFGSGGMVRKGLDLTLEVFAEMPDYELIVCGPATDEKDFERAYYKELYQSPNIRAIGWVDIASQEFLDVMNGCVGIIYPSCCEGQCTGVVSCMHAGLIPVVSYETGVDVHDFGLILKTCSLEEIKEAVRYTASLPVSQLRAMGRKAWEYARANHTRERFAQVYRAAIEQILETHDRGLRVSMRPEAATAPSLR